MAVQQKKMLAAFKNAEGTFDLRETDVPRIGPDQVLIRVKAAGICGGDLHHWRKPLERLIGTMQGHEFCGEVVETGASVEGFSAGDRVAFEPIVSCGKCAYCRTGRYNLCAELIPLKKPFFQGFSQYARVPADRLYPLPDGLSYEETTLADPLTVAVHAVHRARVRPGDAVVIIGAGTVGLLTMQVAKLVGARVIALDLLDSHLEVARRLGADAAVNNGREDAKARVRQLTAGYGADIVFEVVGGGAPTLPLAVSLARNGGTIGVVGVFDQPHEENIALDVQRFEKNLLGISAFAYWGNRTEFQIALDLMGRGQVDVKSLVTHRFPLGEINEAFDTGKDARRTGAIKVVLIP